MKTTAKDFFLNLLVVVGLYVSVGFLVNLVFSFINIWLPDPLEYFASYDSSVRWGTATLVVVFPVFVWASWFLGRIFRENGEARKFWVRVWLLYLTLFIAGGIMIGDLIAVIYNGLNGDLTSRFLLKVAALLLIAGTVFKYYLLELWGREKWRGIQRVIAWAAMAVVAVAVVAGFVVAGSPFAQRARRFDDRRISDLQTIQWQLVNYWQSKEALPKSLDELRNDLSGFVVPVDPDSKNSYEYRLTGERAFELCATFGAASDNSKEAMMRAPAVPAGADGLSDSWTHGVGRACFERTIDPDLYPPFQKTR